MGTVQLSSNTINNSDLINGRGTREFQDFFTPPAIAKQIADEYLRPLFQKHKLKYPDPSTRPPFRLLEPSVGSGNLLWPAIEAAQAEGVQLDIVCFDLQLDYLVHVQQTLLTKYGIEANILRKPLPLPNPE